MRRLFSVFFLAACGGGDSGGETEQDPVYDLTEYKSLDEGEKYLFTLTGSDLSQVYGRLKAQVMDMHI